MDKLQLKWPELAQPYDLAIRDCIEDILPDYEFTAVFAAGSVVRGQGGPTSDIDIYAVHSGGFRQRLQRRYQGVPFEIFINPIDQIRKYFKSEHQQARQCAAHMVATGFLILERDESIQKLRIEAQKWLDTPPNFSEEVSCFKNYMTVDLIDNARDLINSNPIYAKILLHRAVTQLIEIRFLQKGKCLPRDKDTLTELAIIDKDASSVIKKFTLSSDIVNDLDAVISLADRIIGTSSFFEWDSIPEKT